MVYVQEKISNVSSQDFKNKRNINIYMYLYISSINIYVYICVYLPTFSHTTSHRTLCQGSAHAILSYFKRNIYFMHCVLHITIEDQVDETLYYTVNHKVRICCRLNSLVIQRTNGFLSHFIVLGSS